MDLGAYAQIEDLSKIAANNDIKVPRLRGYRLMKDEKTISSEDIEEMLKEREIEECECLIESEWQYNSCILTINDRTRRNVKRYIKHNKINWDKIHGKHRKTLKFAIKKAKKAIKAQYDIWNKYVGRDDVLYIHSRIGGNNWRYFSGDELVASQPWFLDRVDDNFDSTYCDIYAKIDPNTITED